MKNLVFAVFVLLGCSSLSARDIKGVVISDNDSTAVIGALCELKTNDVLVAKTVTLHDGTFVIDENSKDEATLVISMSGYSNTDIFIPAGSKDIYLGEIFLNGSVTLGELTVSAQQVVQGKQGRTIVFPSSAEVKASPTSLSLFGKLPLPGLDVSAVSRTISVDGGTPVILINGVPSDMTDVNSLQAKDIDRVEYSRVIPARYADSGKTGFINIILKQHNDGGSVYAWLRGCPTTCFFDANLNATYHQGPSQFSLTYTPSWRNYQSVYDDEVGTYVGDDFKVNLQAHDRNPFNYFYNQFRAKYNYRPNNATLFSATLSANILSNASRTIEQTIDSNLGEYDNNLKITDKLLTPSLDLFLHRDFNDKNSLEVQVVGTLSSDDYNRNSIYDFADGDQTSYSNNVENRRRSLISEVCYNHDFSDKTSLSAGLQNTVSHSTNKYLSTDYKPVLTENNNYAYVRLGQQIKKVYVSLSTGMKLFWMENDLNKRNFVRNLSSALVKWNINKKWNVQGSVSFSPSIPDLSSLTDYAQQQTPYLISNGNPDLKTYNNWNVQISPSFNYKNISVSWKTRYYGASNPFMNQYYYLGNELFLSQSNNYDYQRSLTNSLSIRLSDNDKYGIRANLYLESYWTAGDGWKKSLTSFNGQISAWWTKNKFTIDYTYKLPGKYLNGYIVGKEENMNGLDLIYTPNKHWTLTAGWWYMFVKRGTQYPSWGYSPVYSYSNDRYIKDNGNMIVLSVSYSADFGTLFNTGSRSLNNSDSGSSLFKN